MKTCTFAECGKPYRARGLCATHYNQTITPELRHRKYWITCVWCGREHESTRPDGRFCSISCGARFAAQGRSASRKALVHVGPSWPYTVIPEQHPARHPAPKRSDWWTFLVAGACRRCGAQFVARACKQRDLPSYCSERCARKMSKLWRRVRARAITSESYTLGGIADRDRRTCQLCGKRVAMTESVPHPKAPTVDHVLPLSEGGDDTRANVQLAHFLCNATKGSQGSQQLALFG